MARSGLRASGRIGVAKAFAQFKGARDATTMDEGGARSSRGGDRARARAWASRWLWPAAANNRPKLAEVRPLPPVTQARRIIVPAVVSLTAVRDAIAGAPRLERQAKPAVRAFRVQSRNELVGDPWRLRRLCPTGTGSGSRPRLTVRSASAGPACRAFRARSDFPERLGIFSSWRRSRWQPAAATYARAERAELRAAREYQRRRGADRTSHSAAGLAPAPNLRSQITVDDASISVMGNKLSLSAQMKPLLERAINEQVSQLQSRIANDPSIEQEARREWAKMCRSISLGAAPGKPNLWLELRPTRAFAAQPGIDRSSVTLAFGVEAETRIVPSETRPDCPFPARFDWFRRWSADRSISPFRSMCPSPSRGCSETQLKGRLPEGVARAASRRRSWASMSPPPTTAC